MSIFKINDKNLQEIREISIDLEKDLQKIVEQNLTSIFGLQFISSEFSLHEFRIDTLGFDEETNSFVIIEYKKDRSFSVIDQGYAYLALMLNNKADFILEYNEKNNKNLKREDVDWSQSRVIFLANSFTSYQQNAINFKDLPIELWEAKKFDNATILFNELKSPNSNESIKTVSKNKTIEKVNGEVKKYTIEDHFKKNWENSRNLFEILKEKILSLQQTKEVIQKHYIAYKVLKNDKWINFIEICTQSKGVKIYLDSKIGELDDYKKILQDCSGVGHWTTGDCFFYVFSKNEIDYAFLLIKQVYEKFYSKDVK